MYSLQCSTVYSTIIYTSLFGHFFFFKFLIYYLNSLSVFSVLSSVQLQNCHKFCYTKFTTKSILYDSHTQTLKKKKTSPTVENLIARGVLLPTCSNTFALLYFVMSWVTSKYPNAPANNVKYKHVCTYTITE